MIDLLPDVSFAVLPIDLSEIQEYTISTTPNPPRPK